MAYPRNLWGIGLGLLAFAVTAATVDAQPQPNLKSWSKQISNANQRFEVLSGFNNEAVLDKETGLGVRGGQGIDGQ